MKNIILLKILFFSIFLIQSSLNSQEIDKENVTKDTLACFKYDFKVGDVLKYRVVSNDSIVFSQEGSLLDEKAPLIKNRFEEITITCDSIKDGKFYLTHYLSNYIAFESQGDIKNVKRVNSPWVGRRVWFAIDSLGKRYKVGYDDSLKASLTTGGAFQPHLITYLGETCKKKDAIWNVQSLDELVENGLPTPLIKQLSLFRYKGIIDTLDKNCNRLSFIKTAQGSYKVKDDKANYYITSIIAGAGIMDIDTVAKIPVHLMSTIEAKITTTINDSKPQKGKHYIMSNFTLIDFNRKK